MSTQSNNTSSAGIFFGAHAGASIVFITLKLTHVIDWDWWWVLSPIWISLGILLAIFAVVCAVIVLKD